MVRPEGTGEPAGTPTAPARQEGTR
jgi:hypothetical protein